MYAQGKQDLTPQGTTKYSCGKNESTNNTITTGYFGVVGQCCIQLHCGIVLVMLSHLPLTITIIIRPPNSAVAQFDVIPILS